MIISAAFQRDPTVHDLADIDVRQEYGLREFRRYSGGFCVIHILAEHIPAH